MSHGQTGLNNGGGERGELLKRKKRGKGGGGKKMIGASKLWYTVVLEHKLLGRVHRCTALVSPHWSLTLGSHTYRRVLCHTATSPFLSLTLY